MFNKNYKQNNIKIIENESFNNLDGNSEC